MKPYYEEPGVTIYHGDALELLATLEPVDTIITDPPWPDCEKTFPGVDADALFSAVAKEFPRLCKRLVVVLGVDTDPRFLRHVPAELPFFRLCWMEFMPARYRGTLLASSDIAYVFGSRYLCGQAGVLPGRMSAQYDPQTPSREEHPCARNTDHMRWLVREYTKPGETILDPFMGSGTLARAVKDVGEGRKFIGIEIKEKYCELAVKKMAQGVLFR